MSLVRVTTACLVALALSGSAEAARDNATRLNGPTKLHAFLPDQSSSTTTFSRTPAFGWNPVRGAKRYELVLSTSPLFAGNGLVWDDATLTTPVAAVPIALPWITGSPHSLYARVRGISPNGTVGAWSQPYGFDMRWTGDGVAEPLDAPNGLVRWTPIDGATSYQVWYLNTNVSGTGKSKIFSTTANVADEREYYTFHQASPFIDEVMWRVRAVRQIYGSAGNKLPAVTYGPWSPPYFSQNTDFTSGPLGDLSTLAEPAVAGHDPAKDGFELPPAFVFDGDSGIFDTTELYRVYVYSDEDCINPVFKGAMVGSPAYAPRTSGPLGLPTDGASLTAARSYTLPDGQELGRASDGDKVIPTEATQPSSFTPQLIAQAAGSSGTSTPSSSTGAEFPTSLTGAGAPIGLWDTNWPTGRYFWTVVPVAWSVASDGSGTLEYWDTEVGQDACTVRSASFGQASQPAPTVDPATHAPFAWGLSPKGTLLQSVSSRKPIFYGVPLVAWKPALGATAYEVQWSKKSYPWQPEGNLYTFSTSTTLALKAGTWYYRVRGINLSLPTGASTMAWSSKVGLVIAKPKFKVVGGK